MSYNNKETTTTTVELEGTAYRVTIDHAPQDYRDRPKTARLFISGEGSPDGRPPYDHERSDLGDRGGIYVNWHGPVHPGWAEHDKAWKKYNRREVARMKVFIKAVLPAADINFSKHAGCSMCPCSPGFRLNNAYEVGGHTGGTTWLTFKSMADVVADDEAAAAAALEKAIIQEAGELAFV